MSLRAGDRLGPYEVLQPIGAGGMGEVYRARDTRLDRDVAIKVLPDAVAHDPERLARFQREAKTLAALNHPHIAQIYGVEGPALAMEYVEGEDLSARIARGPIAVDDALEIASDIAEALEAAHDLGIVHRDLKASNIRLRPDGAVKVLDFGLAKALAGPGTSIENVSAPTITTPAVTHAGVVLGTAAYMAPEQAKGKAVDKRADIWAFGIVVYEMVTGRRPFDGESVSESLAGVLKSDPDWTPVPAEMRRLLRSCLEKDPKKRLRDIGDWRRQLDDAAAVVEPVTTRTPWLAWSLSAVFALAAGLLAFLYFGRATTLPERATFEIPVPARNVFETSLAVSPDGRRVAFTATGADSIARIWVRDLAHLEARSIAGTEGARNVSWSPDGQSMAFKVGRAIKRIPADGGPALTLYEAESGDAVGGAAWSPLGVLVIGGYRTGAMRLIPETGGKSVPLTSVDPARREAGHGIPAFLPDGKHFLYARVGTDQATSGLYVGSIDLKPEDQDRTRLLPASHATYVSRANGPGALLYLRQSALVAHTFDASRLTLIGEPVPIVEGVANFGALGFFAAAGPVLAYRAGDRAAGVRGSVLTWLDRKGQPAGVVGKSASYDGVWLSRDGKRAAVIEVAPAESGLGNIDIWTVDLTRGIPLRITSHPGVDRRPVWSPTGDRLIFYSMRTSGADLYVVPSGGSGTEVLQVTTDQVKIPSSWSRDGRYLLFTSTDPVTRSDIWLLPLEGDRKPVALLQSTFAEGEAQFSEDMKWIAYTSNVSGRSEIYIRPFNAAAPAAPSDATRISNDGARFARWRRDGRELYFESLEGVVMAVDLTPAASALAPSPPKPLFTLPQAAYWDVAPDGERFLVTMPSTEGQLMPITVMMNWWRK